MKHYEEYKHLIFSKIQEYHGELAALNDYLADHPEISGQEYESSKAIVELLRRHGCQVEYPFAGQDTAFRGVFGPDRHTRKAAILAEYDALPEVDIVAPENLFQCDVFVFVASKGIPPVGSQVKDVRMYQFENNSKIVALYARQARRDGFKGLFAVVSDPVDPLAKTAWLESNKDENGVLDYQGLRPEQVQGFGLGVMNARAAYYAKRDERFKQFLTEGRSFGPHGEDLVVADSIERYNDELSKELTHLTVTANLHMRAIGFKPFIAPAYSSGAISLILTLRGEWHCGSVFLGGIFMGVKNRYTPYGLETEILPLPEALYERIVTAQEHLKTIV